MAKGDGTITELFDKDGKSYSPKHWRVQVYFGRNPVTGRYDRATETVRGTKADAVKVRDRLRQERDNGISADGAKMTFAELADMWLDSRLKDETLSESTLDTDKREKKKLCAVIGGAKLSTIRPHTVELALEELERQFIDRNGKMPSGSTRCKWYQHFDQIMQRAVDYDLILRNPVDRVKAPKQTNDTERQSLDLEQATGLLDKLNSAEEAEYAAFEEKEQRRIDRGAGDEERTQIRGLSKISRLIGVRIGLATGERYGEIIGLTWEHVDLNGGVIHVAQSLKRLSNKLGKPKTKKSRRKIAIDAETVAHLKRWKSFQLDVLSEFGITAKKQEKMPVCCSNVGGWLNNANLGRWWREWREKVGCSGFTIHELRHTNASQLVSSGFDPVTIIAMMGWSSIRMLDVYAHPQEKDRKSVV